jgi:hypothetical protein
VCVINWMVPCFILYVYNLPLPGTMYGANPIRIQIEPSYPFHLYIMLHRKRKTVPGVVSHSSTDEHFGYFQFFPMVNGSMMKTFVWVFYVQYTVKCFSSTEGLFGHWMYIKKFLIPLANSFIKLLHSFAFPCCLWDCLFPVSSYHTRYCWSFQFLSI